MSQVGFTERSSDAASSTSDLAERRSARPADSRFFQHAKRGLEAVAVATVYVAVAKLGLALASVNPSATPVWPPTGYALAIMLLLGYRVAPAIFAGAFIANATTAGSVITWLGIAMGNTLECVVATYLILHFAQGRDTFDTPGRVAKFALICFVPATLISATVGVLSLGATGYAAASDIPSIWMTWWMGDLAGALVIAPAIVLWALDPRVARNERIQTAVIYAAAVAVGVIAFSPLVQQTTGRAPLAFLAILPLMAAALRCGQRETASVGLLLSAFAVWGTIGGSGPFAQKTENDSFLLLLAFMISVSVPSLALSAEVAVRKASEKHIKFIVHELSHRSKNLLAIVQGVANQIARRTDTFETFQPAFMKRLQAISQTHDLLVRANWEGTGLRDLITVQLAPFHSATEGAVIAEGPDLRLHAKAAEQIGFALYELGTNAAKHGSLSRRAGFVNLRWGLEFDDTRRERLRLTWQEAGGPAVNQAQRQGFGTFVLTKLVPMTLGGTASLTFDPDGVNWFLVIPASSAIVA